MKKEVSPKLVSLAFGILTVSFLAAFYVFAWTEPTQAPPGGNVPAPVNVGSVEQIKSGNLTVNALGVSASGNALLVPNGNVGIGTASPSYKLDVSGDIRAISLINTGGSVLPSCAVSNRGQQFLLQSGAGTADGFYICKKKSDDTYAWSALGSPEIVTIWDNQQVTAAWPVKIGNFGPNPEPNIITITAFLPAEAEILVCSAKVNTAGYVAYTSGYIAMGGRLDFSAPANFSSLSVLDNNSVPISKAASILGEGGQIQAKCTTNYLSDPNNLGYYATTYCTFSCYYIKKK